MEAAPEPEPEPEPAADLLFAALDADGAGLITRQEMRQGLGDRPPPSPSQETRRVEAARRSAAQAMLEAERLTDVVQAALTPQRPPPKPHATLPLSTSPSAFAMSEIVHHANSHVSTMQSRLEEVERQAEAQASSAKSEVAKAVARAQRAELEAELEGAARRRWEQLEEELAAAAADPSQPAPHFPPRGAGGGEPAHAPVM